MAGRRFALYWLPPVLYLALIFTLSGMSHPPIPAAVDQNLLHYPEFAVLAALLVRALAGDRRGFPGWGVLLAALVFSSVWGALDELHQAFVPGRVPDPLDWWHDTVGAVAGAGLWGLFRRWRP